MIRVGSLTLSRRSPLAPAPLISPWTPACLRCGLLDKLNSAGIWFISRKKLVHGVECSKVMVVADRTSTRILQKVIDLRLKRSSECSGYAQALALAGTYLLLQLTYFLSRRNCLREMLLKSAAFWSLQQPHVYAKKVTLRFAAICIHVLNKISFGNEGTHARLSISSTDHLFGVFVFPNKLQHISGFGETTFAHIKAHMDAADDMVKTSETHQGDARSGKGQSDGSSYNSEIKLTVPESNLSSQTEDESNNQPPIGYNNRQTALQEYDKEQMNQSCTLLGYPSWENKSEHPPESNLDAFSSLNSNDPRLEKNELEIQGLKDNSSKVLYASEERAEATTNVNQSQLYESTEDSMWTEQVKDSGGTNSKSNSDRPDFKDKSKVGSSLKLVKPTVKREDLFFLEEGKGLPMELVYTSKEKLRSKLEEKASSESSVKEKLSTIRQMADAGSFHDARSLCQQLLERFPRNPRILVEYAHVERKFGNLVAARALFSDAILAFKSSGDLGTEYIRAIQVWGSLEMKVKDFTKARYLFMESFHEARKIEISSPQNSEVASVYGLHSWAMVEEKLGNWNKARELLERAAIIEPRNAVVHLSRALLEARAHNYSTARNCFRLGVSSAPDDVKCWQAWALFEASQAKPQKMRQLFRRALSVDPKNIHSLQAWAHQESIIGTKESRARAKDLYRKCTEVDPKSMFSWQAWAILERDCGNDHEARALFEKALSIRPSCVPSLQAYANMERVSGNLEAAQKLLRKALVIEPENAAVLMEAALVEKSLGNEEASLEFFKLARRSDKQKSRIKRATFTSRKTSPRLKIKFPLNKEKK